MNIGNFELNGYAALAPMAGVTDRAFRELCMEFGSAYCTSEMVSSKGLIVHDRKSELLINMSEKERPCEVQIFGNDPAEMALAAKKAEQTGCFAVDINMGCPAPKVAAHGSGSALMKNPELAGEITNACVNAVGIPVTCKIRSGWDEDSINAVETAKILEKAGASAITVHGRTRRQMYAPPVNLDIIRRVKEAVNIPVIGNGDIFDCRSALEMYEKTKCDFAAIGRGALGNPWIFSRINSFFETGEIPAPPGIEERMTVMINHIVQLCEYKGDYVGIREARKHAGWYIKGIRGAASFRREIGSLESTDDLRRLAENVIKSVMNEGEN
ncbi:MAG: tRNA dihydrouridine synthase DusB [Clostridia bacterium]|nr:tRNA dihydrouridine synthase DusB [Clostridia bacterium]